MARSENPRDVQLKLMLTVKERASLACAALLQGESVSTYVRRALREQMRRDASRRQRHSSTT